MIKGKKLEWKDCDAPILEMEGVHLLRLKFTSFFFSYAIVRRVQGASVNQSRVLLNEVVLYTQKKEAR